jgi:hypothetical protein
MPGLLYAQIREPYNEQRSLPLAQLPEEVRRQESAFANLPLIQFLSPNFLVQAISAGRAIPQTDRAPGTCLFVCH